MEIRAFRGWRYRTEDGDVGALIAPPYDVLTQADKEALLAGDERNIVGVDLPHVPPVEAGPDACYRAVANGIGRWKASGVLAQEPRPALYLYEQHFAWSGREYRRRALVAAVRLKPFGEGVWPHERTFPGPAADRLKLMEATGMQTSPVFGFYEGGGELAETLLASDACATVASAELGGVRERLSVVCDEAVIRSAREALRGKDLFIADGHHRYRAALEYRQRLGRLDPEHPAGFVMCVLVGMDDPALIVLPTHRVISGLKGFSLEAFVAAAGRVLEFSATALHEADVADADGFLRPFGAHAMCFVGRDEAGRTVARVGRVKDLSVMARLLPEQSPTLRELDVSVLHRLVLDRCLGEHRTNEMLIRYTHDAPSAVRAVEAGSADLAVLLRATPLEAVRRVALAGEVMPHKSTYFHPKPATGMVLYPLG